MMKRGGGGREGGGGRTQFYFAKRDEISGFTLFLQLLIGVTQSSSLRFDVISPTDLNGFLCILPSTHPSKNDYILLLGNFTPVTSSL